MKKIGVLFLAFLLTLIVVSAQNETSIEEKALTCLENKVKDKCPSLTLEEQAFSLLALAHKSDIQSECKNSLKKLSKDNECWPSTTCKIKDTSLAILALNNINEDIDKAEKWLISKNKTSPLEWYLEIDLTGEASCKLSYDTTSKTITINEDKTISGEPGNCFSLAYNNYWLRIKDTCLEKKFEVSCNKDFISTLLYKKTGSNIWHVSSQALAASANGKTEHTINSYCFSAEKCNYEENLWAVLALQKTGYDVSSYLPYLIVFSEDNKKYFPDSFLYITTNSEDYLQEILNLQKKDYYWDLSGNKFYDTALALLALSESEAEDSAKSWLEETQDKTKDNEGCWNNGNIRDTAFLLWAGWPKEAVTISGIAEMPDCEPTYHCINQGECDEADGNVLRNFACLGLKICCDKSKKEKTCEEEGGKICEKGKICESKTFEAFNTKECCLKECEEETSKCEKAKYVCRTECSDDEEKTRLDCPSGKTCCKPKEEKSYWYIWLLVSLIILVILGIIFRNKLRVLIFRLGGGFKVEGVTKTRPTFPPGPTTGLRRMIPSMQRPIARTITKTDKELEETLKKLKEMSG